MNSIAATHTAIGPSQRRGLEKYNTAVAPARASILHGALRNVTGRVIRTRINNAPTRVFDVIEPGRGICGSHSSRSPGPRPRLRRARIPREVRPARRFLPGRRRSAIRRIRKFRVIPTVSEKHRPGRSFSNRTDFSSEYDERYVSFRRRQRRY